jgi:hypothetical protein
MAVALAMAFVLNYFPLGFWGRLVSAGTVMALLPALSIAAIAGGHCRNQWVAILFLEAVGVVFLAGWNALAFLHPLAAKADAEWIKAFHLALFCVYSVGAMLASMWATHAYCEACGCWMRCQRVILPAGTIVPLAAALRDGTLPSFAPVSAAGVAGRAERAVVDLEYCPRSVGREPACAAYLTFKERSPKTKQAAEKEMDELAIRSILHASPHRQNLQYDPHSGARFLVRQMKISPLEVAILAVKIPPLIVAVTPSSASTPQDAPNAATSHSAAAGSIITSLPPGQAIEVSPFFRKFVDDLLSFTAVFLVLVGTAVAAWGYWERPWAAGLAGGAAWLAWFKVGGGGATALVGGLICATNAEYFSRRYRYCWVREAIQRRGNRIVDPDEPEAIFVEVVPRAKWPFCHADDIGFLRLDRRGRQLLFEGLRQRYRIPIDALTYCALEPIIHYDGELNWLYPVYVTVIRVSLSPSPSDASVPPWEAPLLVQPVDFQRNGRRHRYRRAAELRDQIVDAMNGRPSLYE